MEVKIRRWMKFEHLFQMLSKKELTFVSPKKWDDKEDIALCSKYEEIHNVKIYCMCFSDDVVRHHKWGDQSDFYRVGVEFNRVRLLSVFKENELIHESVKYHFGDDNFRIWNDGGSEDSRYLGKIDDSDLPFIKRGGFYSHEKEYRAIYIDKTTEEKDFHPVKFQVNLENLIDNVYLNPRVSDDFVEMIGGFLNKFIGYGKVKRSDLNSDSRWSEEILNKIERNLR